MLSLLNIFLFSGILFFDKVLTLPNPAISPTHPHNYNSLQSLTKPTEINALADTYNHHTAVEPILDVQTTIEQVQNMLERDPSLPRLTRGEIEDLFEQVTKEEYEKSIKAGDFTRAKHMRSLMLVLPFNTESISNDSLQELYNRPPITKVVSSPPEPKPPKIQKTIVPSGKVEIVAVENPTTYKPAFRRKVLRKKLVSPTTYRPNLDFLKTSTTTSSSLKITKPFPELTTPIPFQKIPSKTNSRYSSHYNAKKADFIKTSFTHKRGTTKVTTENSNGNWQLENSADAAASSGIITTPYTLTTSKPKITPELEEILESLGFAAKSQSKKRFKLEDPSLDENPIPIMSSLIKQDSLSIEEFQPIPINLSANDFKKSLIPQTKADDFISFKPLPISNETPKKLKPELENYFKIFGLLPDVDNNHRQSKSLDLIENGTTTENPTTTKTVNVENSNETLTKSPIKRIDTNLDDLAGLDNNEQQRSDEEDYIQLLKLLRNLRELQELNVNLTNDRLKQLDIKNYNLSENLLSQIGPDPIKEADPYDPLKNEIKRQNNPSSTTNSTDGAPIKFSFQLGLDQDDNDAVSERQSDIASSTTTTTTTTAATTTSSTTTTTSTTASPRSDTNGNLADSFSSDIEPVSDESLPQPRRNGFYFLADWNSFLEVGDGDDQVVVRFSPKVGDPSRFIPVNIP